MDNSQIKIDAKNYLVTEKSDIKNFSKEKVCVDLEAIKKAEIRSERRSTILTGNKESAASRAIKVLSLINPFRGV